MTVIFRRNDFIMAVIFRRNDFITAVISRRNDFITGRTELSVSRLCGFFFSGAGLLALVAAGHLVFTPVTAVFPSCCVTPMIRSDLSSIGLLREMTMNWALGADFLILSATRSTFRPSRF